MTLNNRAHNRTLAHMISHYTHQSDLHMLPSPKWYKGMVLPMKVQAAQTDLKKSNQIIVCLDTFNLS